MSIKILGILGVCGVIMSGTAFAAMTPSQKTDAAQDEYSKNQGKHAQNAGDVYSKDLNQTQQDKAKSDEKAHRQNIQDQHVNTIEKN